MRKLPIMLAALLLAIAGFAAGQSARPRIPDMADFATPDTYTAAMEKYIADAINFGIDQRANAPGVVASGRYQLVMRDGVRADTFLFDTATGRIWTRKEVTFIQGDPDIWVLEPRLDSETEIDAWLATQPRKADITVPSPSLIIPPPR